MEVAILTITWLYHKTPDYIQLVKGKSKRKNGRIYGTIWLYIILSVLRDILFQYIYVHISKRITTHFIGSERVYIINLNKYVGLLHGCTSDNELLRVYVHVFVNTIKQSKFISWWKTNKTSATLSSNKHFILFIVVT